MVAYPRSVLSLCSGYGGLELGLRLAVPAARTVCYVEREAYAAALLATRIEEESLDDAPIWSDLSTFDARPWRGSVDCITGGYPCQPFSVAGRRGGTDDPRHLWPHIARLVGELHPRWCFFENVRNHINIGLEQVRDDLHSMGYRVEAGIYSAAEVGASHRRERLFILAHADDAGLEGRGGTERGGTDERAARPSSPALGIFPPGPDARDEWASILAQRPDLAPAVGNATESGREARSPHGLRTGCNGDGLREPFACAGSQGDGREEATQPPVRGLADGTTGGLAFRRDQLRAGGNGVVPVQAAFAFATLVRKFGG